MEEHSLGGIGRAIVIDVRGKTEVHYGPECLKCNAQECFNRCRADERSEGGSGEGLRPTPQARGEASLA